MDKFIIDKGYILGKAARDTSYNGWSTNKFRKYFGATLGFSFDRYKNCSFEFYNHDNDTYYRKQGFADFTEFEQYVWDNLSDGTNYNNTSLTLFLEKDAKIDTLDIYAKNSLYGALQSRGEYRKGKTVESFDYSSWDDSNLPQLLVILWNNHFGDGLTTTYLNNHPDMKRCFYTRDGDRVGVMKDGIRLQNMCNPSSPRRIFNSTDSDVPTDVYATENTQFICNDGQDFYAGSDGNNPRYYIAQSNPSHITVYADEEVGVLPPSFLTSYGETNWSSLATTGFRWTISGKEYHALYISPIGFDTVYFSNFDTKKYRVLSVKKYNNGTTLLKEVTGITADGLGNKIGRVGTGDWFIKDGDTKNNGMWQESEHYFMLQNIATGKVSELSTSYMKQLKDPRFRFPFFTLVS